MIFNIFLSSFFPLMNLKKKIKYNMYYLLNSTYLLYSSIELILIVHGRLQIEYVYSWEVKFFFFKIYTLYILY